MLFALAFGNCGRNHDKRWYVIHVYSGFENKVAESIQEQAAQKGLAELFEQVMVPTEEVVEVRRGQKVATPNASFFPGYVLVKMDMTDETCHLVKNTPKVTGFLGRTTSRCRSPKRRPAGFCIRCRRGSSGRKPSIQFEIGEQVRVADGPFASFNGLVEEVDEERARLKVAVSIFGRATPVELEYAQVEKDLSPVEGRVTVRPAASGGRTTNLNCRLCGEGNYDG